MKLSEIAKTITKRQKSIEKWFNAKAATLRLPLTSSVDIRYSGEKMSVIDTNVFPAGFNNLCHSFSETAANHFRNYFKNLHPEAKKILLIPEGFTRNLNYFLSVRALEKLLLMAGFEVTVGFVGEPLPRDPHTVKLPDGDSLLLKHLDETIKADCILLNNDCSGGIPKILKKIPIPIYPNPQLGWFNRSKKHHFEIYCQLVREFAEEIGLDCWRFCPITRCERDIDIENLEDRKRLALATQKVLEKSQKKHDQYEIKEAPYVFIKSNAGTFGLGLTHVTTAEEVLNFNRKGRQKLSGSKGGKQPSEYLIQEGIPTINQYQGAPIEPVLYYVGGNFAGGFFRVHDQKDNRSSLNAPGARFESLCFHKIGKPAGEAKLHCEDHDDFFKIADWLGRIATLAVGMEEKSLTT